MKSRFNIFSPPTGCPGVCADEQLGGTNDVFALTGTQSNDTLRVRFSRKLRTADTVADRVIDPNAVTHLIYAMSLDESDNLRYHGSQKGGADVYFAQGRSSIDDTVRKHRIAHGVLMFLAWGVIFPIGLGFPRLILTRARTHTHTTHAHSLIHRDAI